jgi:hypothetical protein
VMLVMLVMLVKTFTRGRGLSRYPLR